MEEKKNTLEKEFDLFEEKIKFNESILDDLPRRQGYTLSIANKKGGVGKTTISVMFAYLLARKGIKTLIIDADQQGNATKTMQLTTITHIDEVEDVRDYDVSFMQALKDRSFNKAIVPVIPNLDMIASDRDTDDYNAYVKNTIDNKMDRDFLLLDVLDDIRDDYDVIIIDCPPSNAQILRAASVASDYIVVAFEPGGRSLDGAVEFKQDLVDLKNEEGYDGLQIDILGVVPTKYKKTSSSAKDVLEYFVVRANNEVESSEYDYTFEDLYQTPLYEEERIKSYEIDGIPLVHRDIWDNRTKNLFSDVLYETVYRLIQKELEKIGG